MHVSQAVKGWTDTAGEQMLARAYHAMRHAQSLRSHDADATYLIYLKRQVEKLADDVEDLVGTTPSDLTRQVLALAFDVSIVA